MGIEVETVPGDVLAGVAVPPEALLSTHPIFLVNDENQVALITGPVHRTSTHSVVSEGLGEVLDIAIGVAPIPNSLCEGEA